MALSRRSHLSFLLLDTSRHNTRFDISSTQHRHISTSITQYRFRHRHTNRHFSTALNNNVITLTLTKFLHNRQTSISSTATTLTRRTQRRLLTTRGHTSRINLSRLSSITFQRHYGRTITNSPNIISRRISTLRVHLSTLRGTLSTITTTSITLRHRAIRARHLRLFTRKRHHRFVTRVARHSLVANTHRHRSGHPTSTTATTNRRYCFVQRSRSLGEIIWSFFGKGY